MFQNKSTNKLCWLIALFLGMTFNVLGETSSKKAIARLQMIHNVADPAAEVVDVYLGNSLAVDNFAFRSATPFVNVPANAGISVGIAPANSRSVKDVISSFSVFFRPGEIYVAIASGVLNPNRFAENPDRRSIRLNVVAVDNARESGSSKENVDCMVFHGVTDAPAVALFSRKTGTLTREIGYGGSTAYIPLPAANNGVLDFVSVHRGGEVVASVNADFSNFGGSAAVVFASGFLKPFANQNGPELGVFAAFPNGQVVALPVLKTARLQVIHNAADPAAKVVDVYLDNARIIDNFVFRSATPFIDVTANTEVTLGIAPANSHSARDAIARFPVMFVAGKRYVIAASGVLDTLKFVENPNRQSIKLNLFQPDNVRETGSARDSVNFMVFHGATDAPAVDIQAGNNLLVRDLVYGNYADYLSIPAAFYSWDVVTGSGTQHKLLGTFKADFSRLGGSTAIIFASGFRKSSTNQNGETLGLFAAFPNGVVMELPAVTTARLQMIHNAADPAARRVDVYLDNNLMIDDFGFRTARAFMEVPAGVALTVGIAPSNSRSANEVFAKFPVDFIPGERYVAIASGVLKPGNFAQNPDEKPIKLNVFTLKNAREAGSAKDRVDFAVFHGVTDLSMIDLSERGKGRLIRDISYGEFSEYISVKAAQYILDLGGENSENGILASFRADFSRFGGASAIIFASGFLMPEANQGGEALKLLAAFSNGEVIYFPSIPTSIPGDNRNFGPNDFVLFQNYPNPFNPSTTISFHVPAAGKVTLKVFDLLGQEVAIVVDRPFTSGVHKVDFNAEDLKSGVYFYQIESKDFKAAKKFILVK